MERRKIVLEDEPDPRGKTKIEVLKEMEEIMYRN